jgi:hypothetical protein
MAAQAMQSMLFGMFPRCSTYFVSGVVFRPLIAAATLLPADREESIEPVPARQSD